MKIVTSDQMREIEGRSEAAGVSTDALMEQAGFAVARRVEHHLGHLSGVPVVALIGSGNNGGDGLVMARHLHEAGADITAYLCGDRRQPDPKLDDAVGGGVSVQRLSDDDGLGRLRELLSSASMVVDAVLGTGRSRTIEGPLKSVLQEVAEAKARREGLRVLALDLPSGLDSDTGAVDPACLAADLTVTLGHPKVGLFHHPGSESIGELEVADIGIPQGLDGDVALGMMTRRWARGILPRRPSTAHKGTFGSVMMVVGSRNFVGAASLAAAAATRVGAGLVTVAISESLRASVAGIVAEPTYLPLPESSPGAVSPDAARLVLQSLDQYNALLVGCGLGQAPETAEVLHELLLSGEPLPPTVVDADGLNLLASSGSPGNKWWEKIAGPAVLTPHPGEMSRLTGHSVDEIQADRIGTATRWAGNWNKITVLKGAYTVVAYPDGRAKVSPFANPGLASAGTGDVLAGAIAGLLSQGMPLEDAAALGVYLHGAAAERVRGEVGDTGMVASDLLPEMPRAIRELRG